MAVKYYCDRCNKEMSSKEYGNYEVVTVGRNINSYYGNNFHKDNLKESYKICHDCYEYILKRIKEEVEE